MKKLILLVMLLTCMSTFHAMNLFNSGNDSGSSVTDDEDEKQHGDLPQIPSQRTLLINAIRADNDTDVAIALIDYPDLNVSGNQPGHDDPPLCVAASQGFRTVLECLLANGATVNVRDGNGDSPLHCAVAGGHLRAVKVLYLAGASLELRNAEEQTILHKALIAAPINMDLISWILKKGAHVNAQDKRGNSGAHYACMHDRPDLLELLRARDDVLWDLENEAGITPREMPLLAYYISLPSPPPPPDLEPYTISYANIDDLLGYFYPRHNEHVEYTDERNRTIHTYYCLPELEVDKADGDDADDELKSSEDAFETAHEEFDDPPLLLIKASSQDDHEEEYVSWDSDSE